MSKSLFVAVAVLVSNAAYSDDVSVTTENAATRTVEQALEPELARFEVDVAQARADAANPRSEVIEYRAWSRTWAPAFGYPSVDRHGGLHRRSAY
jgi:hypothetical protein